MKKINDWFLAGTIAGTIGGICHLLWNAGLLLIGIHYKTFWNAMAGLFYSPELLNTPLAQIHGMIDAIGVSAVGGILFSATLQLTGNDYLYIKSLVLSASAAYFLFLGVFPQTGLGKNSAVVPWIALFGFMIFNGVLEGFILKKIYSLNQVTGDQLWN